MHWQEKLENCRTNSEAILALDQLSRRGRWALRQLLANRKVTARTLASLTEFDILTLPNVGYTTLKEIRELAARHGIVLSRRHRGLDAAQAPAGTADL